MTSVSNSGPLSPLGPRQGLSPVRLPQYVGLAGADSAQTAQRAAADSVQLRPGLSAASGNISGLERSVHAAQSTVDELDRVGSLLDELRALVGDAGRRESDNSLAEIQSRIDSIIETISDLSTPPSHWAIRSSATNPSPQTPAATPSSRQGRRLSVSMSLSRPPRSKRDSCYRLVGRI
jgi:hypothetical protein